MKMGDMTSKRSRTAGVVYRVPQKKVTLGIAGTSTVHYSRITEGINYHREQPTGSGSAMSSKSESNLFLAHRENLFVTIENSL